MGAPGEQTSLAADLGVDLASAGRLSRYLDLLDTWSERTNLTAARTRSARLDLLVRPVVPAARALRPGRLLDLGSGNGSPGLVLAALRPDVQATLLEPRMKRWAFLREAARAMGLAADVRRERHDEYAGPPSATVTIRALSLPPAELAALVAPGGCLLVWGACLAADPDLVPEDGGDPGVHAYRRRG